MRKATLELLQCLKRQKKLRLTWLHFYDLARDAEALGVDEFAKRAFEKVAPRPKTRKIYNKDTDALLTKMRRYQKQSGLTMASFITHVNDEVSQQLSSAPNRGELRSGPKFVEFLRRNLDEEHIERAFGKVLEEYF